MKKLSLLVLFSCSFLFLISQTTVRALFVGNSYTYVNGLPNITANLAAAGGDTLIHDSSTPGGASLQGHSSNSTTLSKIRLGTWDYVVLQDQSQRPSFSPGQVAQQVLPYAQRLVDSIRVANHCTEPVFYMTWGRKNGDAMNCAAYPPVCTYEGMQGRLRSSYMLMANNNQCTVAPVGSSWWQSIIQNPNLELYSADESHPAYAGSYLAACVFYSTFFQKSPVGLNYYGALDTATATFLQNIADLVVFDSLSQWRIGANEIEAGFTHTAMVNGEVTFTNTSSFGATGGFVNYSWDFGDGNTSTTANPIHTYMSPGPFLATLVIDDGCMQDTITDTINVIFVGVEEALAQVNLYPNPSEGLFWVGFEAEEAGEVELGLWDVAGKEVWMKQVEVKAGKQQVLVDGTKLPKGVYLLRMEMGGKSLVRRVQLD